MDTITPLDKTRDITTYSFVGVAAYMIADIVHEVVGHAGTCLFMGYKIELLTSVYFRSRPESMMVSIGGPLANLLFALLLFTILVNKKDRSILLRLLILTTMAYNLFWFSGTLLQSVVSNTGDWSYISEYYLGSYSSILLILTGITAYYLSIKQVRLQFNEISSKFGQFPLKRTIFYSFYSGTIAAVIAGFLFTPDRIAAAGEGLLEIAASIPILFLIPSNNAESKTYTAKFYPIATVFVFILYVVFCTTLGRGIY